MSVDLTKVPVFVGGLLGATLVFVFSALAIKAVGTAAQVVIEEVRRQFRENPGIMAGTSKPDYARCVDIVTRARCAQMVRARPPRRARPRSRSASASSYLVGPTGRSAPRRWPPC